MRTNEMLIGTSKDEAVRTMKFITGTRGYHVYPRGGGGTPLCDLNGDVRPDRVWFSGCFVLNGVPISSLLVLNRVSLHHLMA